MPGHIVFELSIHPSEPYSCPEHISILFEVVIPNSMCEDTLGSRSVAYYFGVTVTLTLILEKLCPEHISDII